MKIFYMIMITTTIFSKSVFTPAYSQDNTINNEATGNRTLSAGIGFPDYSQPMQRKVGLGIGLIPEYEGSDNYSATGLPLIDIRKPGHFFVKGASINPNDGWGSAGLTMFHLSYSNASGQLMQFVMGPLIYAHGGRDESDSDVVNGLGDIDKSVSIGGFMEVYAGPWLTHVSVSSPDTGNDKDGLLVTLDVMHTKSVSDRMTISTGLSTSWANDDYMQGYFGITNTQSVLNGLPPFNSKSGFKDVGLQLKTSYAISPRWSLDGQVGYWRLLNTAADSPIVQDEGSANQIRGLVGLSYRF